MKGMGDIKNYEYDRWVESWALEAEMLESLCRDYWVMSFSDWATFKICVEALKDHLTGKKFLNLRSLGLIIGLLEEVPQLDFRGERICN